MRVTRDFRWNSRFGGQVNLTMTFGEFREMVEMLESLSPDDGFTRDLRAHLDGFEPPDLEDGNT